MEKTFDGIRLKGTFKMQLVDRATGEVFYEYEDPNLVVDAGKLNIAKLLGGDAAGKKVSQIGVGTSGTAPAVTDTGLTGTVYAPLTDAAFTGTSTPAYGTNTVTFYYIIDTATANGMAIREFGLFNPDNVLIARKVIDTAINKTSSFAITGTWTITIL